MTRIDRTPRARRAIRTATPRQWRNRLIGAATIVLACGVVVWLLGVSLEGALKTVALLASIAAGAWGVGRLR